MSKKLPALKALLTRDLFAHSLDLFYAKLSPEMYWWGQRSQRVRGRGTLLYTVTSRMTPILRWAVVVL